MNTAHTTGWGLIGASTIAAEHMIGAISAQAFETIVGSSGADTLTLAGAAMMIPPAAMAADAPAKAPVEAPKDQFEPPAAANHSYRGDFSEVDAATAGKGGEVYTGLCGACHEQGLNRAPQRAMLSLMTPESIYRALTTGVRRELH